MIRTIGEYFASMDKKFYEELEGKPEDMRRLVDYLNEIGV